MKSALWFVALFSIGTASGDPLPTSGTITDRRTGETIELTCLNEECESVNFRILDQSQELLAESGPRSISWMLSELHPVPGVADGTQTAWVFGQFVDWHDGRHFPLVALLLAPIGVAFDVVTLPAQIWHELVTIPVRKDRIKQAVSGMNVRVSHRSFKKIRATLIQ